LSAVIEILRQVTTSGMLELR